MRPIWHTLRQSYQSSAANNKETQGRKALPSRIWPQGNKIIQASTIFFYQALQVVWILFCEGIYFIHEKVKRFKHYHHPRFAPNTEKNYAVQLQTLEYKPRMWGHRWYSSCGFMVLIVEYGCPKKRSWIWTKNLKDRKWGKNIMDLFWESTERRPVRDAFPLVQMLPWLQCCT